MTHQNPDALVSTNWLARYIEAVEIRVIYVSWRSIEDHAGLYGKFKNCHLPYAVYFNLGGLFDKLSDAKTKVPSAEKFAKIAKELAIGNGTRVFIYDDGDGLGAGTYLWWLFRLFGHDDVGVVDGGMAQWLADGLETSRRPRRPKPHNFTLVENTNLVCSVMDTEGMQVINCCQAETESDHQICILSTDFLKKDGGHLLKSASEVQNLYDEKHIDFERPIVLAGQSLFAASIQANALYLIGPKEVPILLN